MKKLLFISLAMIFLVSGISFAADLVASPTSTATPPTVTNNVGTATNPHIIMRPDTATLQNWINHYINAPRTPVEMFRGTQY